MSGSAQDGNQLVTKQGGDVVFVGVGQAKVAVEGAEEELQGGGQVAAGGGASLAASARPAAEAYWGWATDMPLLGLHDSGSALLRLPASVAGVEERGVAGVQDLQHDARGWARTRGIGGRIGLEETPNPTKRTEPRASSNAPFFHSPCQLNLDGACALPGALSTDLPSHLLLTLHTRAPVA